MGGKHVASLIEALVPKSFERAHLRHGWHREQETDRAVGAQVFRYAKRRSAMLNRGQAWGAACLSALLYAIPGSAEPMKLESGSYEVEVKLELPHLEDMTQKKIAQICLSADAGSDNHGIAVLSDNNPLSKCPFSNIYEGTDQISFDILCEGKNSAKAKANYVFSADRFQGRITMQMGGKNMTMTEVQSGRRIGACEKSKAPAL
ncbi:DUF3617 domain-containing protein [Methylobacterium sp. C25]|uniref:DUF3617 domain-containing protein n=1 Tax=Methylobacterium sp. C25 TaxID=2721622 RepID=UPI001F1F0C97|nr:DUF3617 family protein [Methylobacterium sp. C25]